MSPKFDVGEIVWLNEYKTTALVLDVWLDQRDGMHRYLIKYNAPAVVKKDWWREDFLSPYAGQEHKKAYGIKKVIYNNPATIILWEDGTKTVVKVQNGDIYSKELGFAMCVSKKYFGNQSNFNNVFKKYVYDKE